MAYQGESFIARYGQAQAAQSPPIRRMLAAGVPVGAGTDATRVASYNPFVSLYWLSAGKTVGGTPTYDGSNKLDRSGRPSRDMAATAASCRSAVRRLRSTMRSNPRTRACGARAVIVSSSEKRGPMIQRTCDLTAAVTEADHAIGPHDARVTIVEYGDFECPNCKQAAPVVKLMLERFAGRIRFVYRHFPLEEVHPHALLAAEAAEAAAGQERFWAMHDLLFASQPHFEREQLLDYAERLELDTPRYARELDGHVHLQRVREQLSSGRASGVRATPGFFLNGSVCDVSFGLQHLEESVEAALNKPAGAE
jgi:protein-disulfide isomerase